MERNHFFPEKGALTAVLAIWALLIGLVLCREAFGLLHHTFLDLSLLLQ
jgi:hypothetical protein